MNRAAGWYDDAWDLARKQIVRKTGGIVGVAMSNLGTNYPTHEEARGDPKRPCRVHRTADRCHRKRASISP